MLIGHATRTCKNHQSSFGALYNSYFTIHISLRDSYCDGVWYLMILFEQVCDNENIEYGKVE